MGFWQGGAKKYICGLGWKPAKRVWEGRRDVVFIADCMASEGGRER